MADFAAVFDMDGVIVDSNPFHRISLKQFSEKYGLYLSEEELLTKLFGRRNAEWLPIMFGRVLTEEEVEKYGEEKEALFREVYKDAIEPLAGLVSFLKMLKQEGVPCAVATSAPPANLYFTLEKTNLSEYFEQLLDATHVTIGKPDPQVYLKAAQALDIEPEKCIVFEDSLAGVQSGKSAGAKVVGITTTHTAEELSLADVCMPDFTTLGMGQLRALFQ